MSIAAPLTGFLQGDRVMLLDGGLATELERRGANLNDHLWSAKLLIERPALIREVHRDYFLAGADVATTASYQATFEGLAKRGIDASAAADLMRLAVTLAIEARDEFWSVATHRNGRQRPLVAASVGPYGAMLADGSEYRGRYGLSEQALIDFHRPRLEVLAASGADLIACETIPGLIEARALARLLTEFPTLRAWISFSCRDGLHDSEGEAIAACAAAMEGFDQVVSIGVNCTAPQYIESLVREIAGVSSKPILVYPNSGEHYDAAAKRWTVTPDVAKPGEATPGVATPGITKPAGFAAGARLWHAAGARLIGGCCRTTPEDIRALRREFAARD